MTAIAERLTALDGVTLLHGSHKSQEAGMCAMEAVAWLAGEAHSDAPQCACPVIARAVIGLNDRIRDDALRTELLRPLLPKIIGSRASREVIMRRGFVAADMAVRVFAPMALEARGRLDLAASLRSLGEVKDRESALVAKKAAAAAAAIYATAAYATDAAAYATDAYADAAAIYATAAYATATAAYATDAASDRRKVYEEGVRMILRMLEVRS